MSFHRQYFAVAAAFLALAPTQALAHAGVLAGADPVAAVLHFVSEPDHAVGLMALAVAASFLSPRVRAAAKGAIDRIRRR